MVERICNIRQQISETAPLIHCITNPISINQCANLVLASGCRPIMAEHPAEVQEITRMAGALLLNLGNITDARLTSIVLSAEEAQIQGIPYVFDAVGTACSELRRNFTLEFLKTHTPTVLKGNYSEIQAIYNSSYHSSGVDADSALDVNSCSQTAMNLARKYGCVVLSSGKTDLVTDGVRLIHIDNGTSQLATVTGTGCMLGALCGCYLAGVTDSLLLPGDSDPSLSPYLTAAAGACAVLGICGELAMTGKGSGTFMVNLMDRLSTLTDDELVKYIKMEEIHFENI